MNVALWIVQVLLGALFVFGGVYKLVMPLEGIPLPFPVWFLRFIGLVELLGGVGLILPGLLRIKPKLTPLAAVGLVIIMIGAVGTGLMAGDPAAAAMPALVGVLAAFVAYGRWKLAPQHDRSRV
jgi:hypothetical protein